MAKQAGGAWLVTGAASGFGREFARRLSARGETLILWDLDESGLESTSRELGGRVLTQNVDVRSPEAVHAAAEEARAFASVGHVITSAGVLRVGPAEDVMAADYRQMIEVNYLGTVHVAQAFLPDLRRAAGRSTLLFVASVAGLRGFPELAGYSASKFAVLGFAQALRDELVHSKVDLRVLCPPPADTPMVRNLQYRPPVYRLSRLFSAEEIVAETLAKLDRRGFVILIDTTSKALWRVARTAPQIVDFIVQRTAR
ncbi:MAG: SDR family NAD(P)-dependent oxidoreductase [Myxococcota bacterium]